MTGLVCSRTRRSLPLSGFARVAVPFLLVLAVPAGVVGAPAPGQTPGASGNPSVTNVAGPARDGGSVTVTGQHLGSHPLGIEWTGGGGGLIEAKPVNTLMRDVGGRWGESLSSGATPPRISDVRAHSHRQSIKSWVDSDVPGSWQSGFEYTHPDRFQEVYATWWTYLEPLDGDSGNCTGPQWKIWRLNDGPPRTRVNDHPGEIWLGANYVLVPPPDCSQGKSQFRIHLYPSNPACYSGTEPCRSGRCACSDWGYPSGEGRDRYRAITPNDLNTWARWEVHARRSDVDVKNGTLEVRLAVPGQPVTVIADWVENICTHRDLSHDPAGEKPWGITETPKSWMYLIWQNYFGSAREGLPTRSDFFIDDIYLQFEAGQARVELGDAPTWDACTHREVQAPANWSDEAVTVTLNRGSFSPGDKVYLFVVREDGRTSEGFPLSLE